MPCNKIGHKKQTSKANQQKQRDEKQACTNCVEMKGVSARLCTGLAIQCKSPVHILQPLARPQADAVRHSSWLEAHRPHLIHQREGHLGGGLAALLHAGVHQRREHLQAAAEAGSGGVADGNWLETHK